MIDIQQIRDNIELYKKTCSHKNKDIDVDLLLKLDDERKSLQLQIDQLKYQQKELGEKKDYQGAKELKTKIQELQENYNQNNEKLKTILSNCPNFIHPEVPIGKDESENVIIRKHGEIPQFDFEPKDHEEIGKILGIIDKEKAAQVTGARFSYLKGDLVLLQNAISNFTFDILTNQETLQKIIDTHGLKTSAKPFVPVNPPLMINFETGEKMGRLHPLDDRFTFPDDKYMMIGSAEHSLGPIHMDETLDAEQLPLRYVANTPAFRREAGTYGKDTKGILRMHQFDKIEMETFCLPEDGLEEQNFIVAIQEYLLQQLELPYQVISICTGDMGSMDYRQIDMETYIPSQGKYRETHTSDYMTDYQARNLNTKYIKENGEKGFVHMNDATAFAMGRILIAIIENYQNQDSSITIPTVLQKYMNNKTHIG